jgi:hypothetical protein
VGLLFARLILIGGLPNSKCTSSRSGTSRARSLAGSLANSRFCSGCAVRGNPEEDVRIISLCPLPDISVLELTISFVTPANYSKSVLTSVDARGFSHMRNRTDGRALRARPCPFPVI